MFVLQGPSPGFGTVKKTGLRRKSPCRGFGRDVLGPRPLGVGTSFGRQRLRSRPLGVDVMKQATDVGALGWAPCAAMLGSRRAGPDTGGILEN
eukprot:3846654-Pyramimonas_sp.AAC.1